MNDSVPPPLPGPVRSAFVTVIGWLCIAVFGLLTPISFISSLMVAAGSPGSSSGGVLGFLTVIVMPPVGVIAGIGLLKRRRWAWVLLLAMLFLISLSMTIDLMKFSPTPKQTIGPDGVLNTTYTSGAIFNLPWLILCIALIAKLVSPKVKAEFGTSQTASPLPGGRKWRVGHRGRDGMYYEEWRGFRWERIDIDGEMLMGRAHHVIYFASPERWISYPEWARHRRDEIIARIKSEFREPDYEYYDPSSANAGAAPSLSSSAAHVPSLVSQPAVSAQPTSFVLPKKDVRMLLLGLVLFVGFGIFMLWTVKDGIEHGETFLPSKHSMRHRVKLDDDPAQFWVCIAFNGAIGVLSTGFGLRFLIALMRKDPPRPH